MEPFQYLIIGGGLAADGAVKGIRELDPQGSIALFSMESDPPYKRPLLSKGLWKGKPLESVWRHTEEQKVQQFLGRKIVQLDPARMVVTDDNGIEYQGRKILLATGGTPRRLPFGGEEIIYFRTLEDYRLLAGMSESKDTFAVIGGGFIGSEIAAALAMNGKKVTMIFPETGIGARVYPPDVSQFLNEYFRKKGVEVLAEAQVSKFDLRDGKRILTTQGGREVQADGVVAGIGLQLNLDLAKSAGIKVGNGIEVDAFLVTSQPDIYAAGDVAEFYNPALNKRLRLEHEDAAVSTGRQAGRNMAGAAEPFQYLPYFYSDLFELGYEAIGELDSRLKTVADWAEPFQKGVIYYFKDERVSGVLLWNVWDKVPAARELIAQPGPFNAGDLEAKKSPAWKIAF